MWKPSSQKPEKRCYHSNVSLAGLANPQGISGRLGPAGTWGGRNGEAWEHSGEKDPGEEKGGTPYCRHNH